MTKARDRPAMPCDALVLRKMWQLAQASFWASELTESLAHGGEPPSLGISTCSLRGDADSDFQCAICLLRWHRHCSSVVALRRANLPQTFLAAKHHTVWAAFADAARFDVVDQRLVGVASSAVTQTVL